MIINVLEYLEQSEIRVPGKTAFSDEIKSIDYGVLADYARRIGTFIINKTGGAKRKPIVVFVDRNIESLISFMGIACSGNFYVPIDKQMPRLRIELIIKTLQPVGALISDADIEYTRAISPDLSAIIYEDALNCAADIIKVMDIQRNIIDTDPLYATFTSGSTGIPKGVVTCQRSVIDMTEALVSTFGFSQDTIFGNQNPFYFDASIKDIYSALKCGATMHIIPKSCFITPASLVEYLNRNKINTILWSASAINLVANVGGFEAENPAYLKNVMFSGEVMHNKVLNYWRKALPGTKFVNLYGPTEITSVCTYYIVDKPYNDDEVLPIGIPFRNTDILILNDDNQLVKVNEIGELCVRGCCLGLGYYNNTEKTKEAFCQNPLISQYPEIIYRTGDMARFNGQGQIMFVSRKDNQVKHMGQRIELGEIEIVVNSLELIEASVCFYDHNKSKIILVYKGKGADKKYILDGIKDRLPKFMFPNIMIGIEDLPYNLNGKIDRALLKKMYYSGDFN